MQPDEPRHQDLGDQHLVLEWHFLAVNVDHSLFVLLIYLEDCERELRHQKHLRLADSVVRPDFGF